MILDEFGHPETPPETFGLFYFRHTGRALKDWQRLLLSYWDENESWFGVTYRRLKGMGKLSDLMSCYVKWKRHREDDNFARE